MNAEDPSSLNPDLDADTLLEEVMEFPLFKALAGRRSRRFGRGMSIPEGPLAYESDLDPVPLNFFEQALLIQAGVGVTGWHFGIPYSDAEPGFSSYTNRFTGRTAPSAAGFGTPEMFYTDDDGVYVIRTRDEDPRDRVSIEDEEESRALNLLERTREITTELDDSRLSLPREAPHYSAHNYWNANLEGVTDFFPIGDVSEQMISLVAVLGRTGYALYDDHHDQFAGNFDPFFEAGVISRENKLPLSALEHYSLATIAMELAMIGQNMVLALQSMGLGGWFFTGIYPLSVMGAYREEGYPGLEFEFQRRDDWALPNPVGREGVYETFTPAFHGSMEEAVRNWVEGKFGEGGTFDPDRPGGYRDSESLKKTVEPYPDLFVDYLVETCSYVFDRFGKFPGTVPTVFMRPIIQAHHLDLGYYDENLGSDSYLGVHERHMERWHGVSD